MVSPILWKGGLKNLRVGLEGRLDEKGGGQFFEWSSGFLEKAIINFTSQFLLDLLFTCRLKDVVSLIIFHLSF